MAKKTKSKIEYARAFTLVELLVAGSIFVLLLAMMSGVINQASLIIRRASSQISSFASARSAFDTLNQRLSLATLNTYWAYDNVLTPTRYMRLSDLQFVIQKNRMNANCGQEVFFQCPEAYSVNSNYQSATGLLNVCGYRVVYGSDDLFRPEVVKTAASPLRWRYRLVQTLQTAEDLKVFAGGGTPEAPAWIPSDADLQQIERPLADNVIALIVWPRLPLENDAQGTALTTDYTYNSRVNATDDLQPPTAHQLPPIIQVTLVAIDEDSAVQMDSHSATAPGVIESALNGKFTDVTKYQDDLDKLSAYLSSKKIKFQIFNTSIIPREGKWSL